MAVNSSPMFFTASVPPVVQGKKERFHSLDALRGLAALSVVFWHWQHFFYGSSGLAPNFDRSEQPLYPVFKLLFLHGWMAVDLFFLLSGFIFFWLYSDSIAQRLVSAKDFFVFRVSRLYPLHLVTLLAVVAGQQAYLFSTGDTYFFVYQLNDVYHFFLNLLMLPSIGIERGYSFNAPFWSVSVEVILYLIFFLFSLKILPLMRSARQQVFILLLLVCAGLVLESIYLPLGRGIVSFFLGGLVRAMYLRVRADEFVFRRVQPMLLATTILAWLLLLLLTTFDRQVWSFLSFEMPNFKWASYFVRMLLFPLTVLALALQDHRIQRYPKVLSMLGDVSYSSYLWHFPLQLAFVSVAGILNIDRSAFYAPEALLLFFGILLLLSYASYHWLEMPLQKLLRSRSL